MPYRSVCVSPDVTLTQRLCILPSSVLNTGPTGPQRTRRQKEPQRQEEPPVAGKHPEEQQEEHG